MTFSDQVEQNESVTRRGRSAAQRTGVYTNTVDYAFNECKRLLKNWDVCQYIGSVH